MTAIETEVRKSPVAYIGETGYARDSVLTWLWAAVAATTTLFHVSDHRLQTARKELLGPHYLGTVVSDRLGAYNDIPIWERALCHAHLKRDLAAVPERGGRIGHVAQIVRDAQRRLLVLDTCPRAR